MSERSLVLDAALKYAEHGWRVVPVSTPHFVGKCIVCSCHRKAGCDKPGKHPLVKDYQRKATTDGQQIEAWWTTWPDANIGLLLTPDLQIVVLDVDNHHGATTGTESLHHLIVTHGPLPQTLEAVSGGGGRHLYYKLPAGLRLQKANGKVADTIEFFTNRFMVLPPSLHQSGARYQWVSDGQEMAAAPSWLIERMTVETIRESEEGKNDMGENQLKHGERNTGLFNLGRVLRNDGLAQSEVLERLNELNDTVCETPLPVSEVEGMVKSLFSPSSVSWANPVFYLEWHVKNYLSDPRMHLLKDYQIGWHARLMSNAFLGGGRLPADKDALFSMSKASDKQLFEKEYEKSLLDFTLVKIEGEWCYVNEELEMAYWKALEKSRTNKKNGSKGGQAAQKRKEENIPAVITNE